jgi:hypothetical protein
MPRDLPLAAWDDQSFRTASAGRSVLKDNFHAETYPFNLAELQTFRCLIVAAAVCMADS